MKSANLRGIVLRISRSGIDSLKCERAKVRISRGANIEEYLYSLFYSNNDFLLSHGEEIYFGAAPRWKLSDSGLLCWTLFQSSKPASVLKTQEYAVIMDKSLPMTILVLLCISDVLSTGMKIGNKNGFFFFIVVCIFVTLI